MWLLRVFFLFSCTKTTFSDTCAWNNCPKWDHTKINIHIVPHTHTDQGFVRRSDDYYTGQLNPFECCDTKGGVQYIFNSFIDELLKNSTRRFTYCETGFLKQWWDDHPVEDQQKLVQLIKNGQIELVGGGWVQPDEAVSHYVDLIDQYTLGLGILNQSFGECGHPKVLWQIDPFGHSREHANLGKMIFSIGYESLFFAREHYLEHDMRIQNKSLDLIWHVSDENGNNITTNVFYNTYSPPDGFCFDVSCFFVSYPSKNDPIVDNPSIGNYNLDEKLNMFMDYLKNRLPSQRHNHFFIPMGRDYAYSNANMWYVNLDKLIFHINQRYSSNITAFYSTPSCYTQALNELNITWPEKSDDFFPLAENAWWIPTTWNNHSYRQVRQLSTVAMLSNSQTTPIDQLERALAISQHHDAVTGTSRAIVTEDYIYRQFNGLNAVEQTINLAFNSISNHLKNNSISFPTQIICRNVNESDCFITSNNQNFSVTVYNSNSQAINTLVRIPIYTTNTNSFGLRDSNGNSVNFQINSVFKNANQINNTNIAPNELDFVANIGPLGFKTYFISNSATMELLKTNEENQNFNEVLSTSVNSISNELIQLDFDEQGLLSTYSNLKSGQTYPLKQEFLYYYGHDNATGQMPSGAYIFRPINGTVSGFTNASLTIVNGSIVKEVRQIFSPWVSQIIRLISNKTFVEFEWTIGPIPKDDSITKEFITRYTLSGLNSNSVFWTDANGRQMVKRTRNYAAQYQYDGTEPIASNYYPISSQILAGNGTTTLGLLTDRSHGGTSMVDGQIELMLHRRCLYDDYLGVGEPLDEPGRDGRGLVVRGKHWLILGDAAEISKEHRLLALEMYNSPVLLFSIYNNSIDLYMQNFVTEFSALQLSLPQNLNILTLKPLDQGRVLLRLEHIYQKNEDPTLSQPITINLSKIFANFQILQIQEMSLAANNVLGTLSNTTVTLNSMDIRTFILLCNPNEVQNTSASTTGPTPNSAALMRTQFLPLLEIILICCFYYINTHL